MSESTGEPIDETGPVEPQPLSAWQIPTLMAEETVEVRAMPGRITAVVGPNGSGKSALGYWLSQNTNGAPVRRVIAHRRLWFEYAGPDITSAQRESLETNITNWGAQVDSRWRDHAQAQRAGFVLFDLLAHINDYNARVVALVKDGVSVDEVWRRLGTSLLDRINVILRDAHLGISLAMTNRASFDAVSTAHAEATPYPISEMSDGEKSALLLAAEVMTLPQASVVIIDEPERHLHRLISAALIEAIVGDRPDCHFVVLTHDLDLASSLPRNTTALAVLGTMSWTLGQPTGWDIRLVDQGDWIPESVRQAILGGRRRLLFLEGERHSLDLRLYQVLFPGWTLMPVGGCDQVIRAVSGLLASETHHWVHGRGIVDGDGRDENDRAALAARGVLALSMSEVESLYYSLPVRKALAMRQAETFDKEAADLLEDSKKRSLDAIRAGDTRSRLAASVAEKIVSRAVFDGLPSRTDLAAGLDPITVTIPSPFPQQLAKVEGYLSVDDLENIIKEYPIRDTSLRVQVSASLGFKSAQDYEAAALVRIRNDADLANSIRNLVGQLPEHAALPAT